MCKLCSADINVKRKEKKKQREAKENEEKNDESTFRRYKKAKNEKFLTRMISQNAIKTLLFMLCGAFSSEHKFVCYR